MSQIKQIAMPESHQDILRILQALPRGKVLDAPCGAGYLSQQLDQLGFELECCDIDSGNFELSTQFDLKTADFNSDLLPFDSESFDYIVCANGLHRLYNPSNALNEFVRLIRPGGQIILSWPNYHSIARRLKFLLTGSLGRSIEHAEFDQTIDLPAAQVRYPLSAEKVNFLLRHSKLLLQGVSTSGWQIYDYALTPLSAPIAITGKFFKNTIDNRWPIVGGGNTSILIYQKPEDKT